MHPSLPFGPFTVPTGPVLAMLAVVLALEVAGRVGRKMGVHPDDVWNTGLLGLLAALIVARIWTIIQLRDVYLAEPMLMVSLRPSGFAFWPGVVTFVVAAYANLIRQRLDPVRMAAAFAVGLAAGSAVWHVSAWLTGTVVGLPTELPWSVRYFAEKVHPVGIYLAAGMVLAAMLGWWSAAPARAVRTIWLVVLGGGIVHLLADAFVRDPGLIGSLRQNQVLGLAAALLATLMLARRPAVQATTAAPEAGDVSAASAEPPLAAPPA